jgi:hypothetical protein
MLAKRWFSRTVPTITMSHSLSRDTKNPMLFQISYLVFLNDMLESRIVYAIFSQESPNLMEKAHLYQNLRVHVIEHVIERNDSAIDLMKFLVDWRSLCHERCAVQNRNY